MNHTKIIVEGYWNVTNEPFEALCQIGVEDSEHYDVDYPNIFYYFNEDADIIGDHGDFTILYYTVY